MGGWNAPSFASSNCGGAGMNAPMPKVAHSAVQVRGAATVPATDDEEEGVASNSRSSGSSVSAASENDDDEPGTSHCHRSSLARLTSTSEGNGPGPPLKPALSRFGVRSLSTSSASSSEEGERRGRGGDSRTRGDRGDRDQGRGERGDRPDRGDRGDRAHASSGGDNRGDRYGAGPRRDGRDSRDGRERRDQGDRRGGDRAGSRGGGDRGDKGDTLDLLVAAKEAFLKKAVPINPLIRESLYQSRWDKLLIDVRRSVHLKPQEGKVETYTAMVAVGNMNGLLGLGVADAGTAQEAVAAAHMEAYKRLTPIPLYRGHTLYHRIEHNYNMLKLTLEPRPEGWGVKASELVTQLCNLAGLRNVSIKVHARRRTRFFVAAALQEALTKQTLPHLGVEGSGVYVREVWAGTPFGVKQLPANLIRGVDVL